MFVDLTLSCEKWRVNASKIIAKVNTISMLTFLGNNSSKGIKFLQLKKYFNYIKKVVVVSYATSTIQGLYI